MPRLELKPADTVVFREAKPLGAFGGSEVQSQFPPPGRTVQGALRTMLGDRHEIDWQAEQWPQWIGDSEQSGAVRFAGPYLHDADTQEIYLPLPAMIVRRNDDNAQGCERLKPSEKVYLTDQGRLRLPTAAQSVKDLHDCYVSAATLQKILDGTLPAAGEIRPLSDFYADEVHTSVALDPTTRVARESMLFQLMHVRLKPGISIVIDVADSKEYTLPQSGLLRFGARGRLAGFSTVAEQKSLPAGRMAGKHAFVTFVTPADFGGKAFPEGAVRERRGDADAWTIEAHGVRFSVVCAAGAKPLPEGGYDLRGRQGRAVRMLVPAGTTWFIEYSGDLADLARKLSGRHLGLRTENGYGQVVVGSYNT